MLVRLLKEMMVIFLGFVAVVYLVFPTLGIFELIPDAIPLIGSLDEAGATLLLLNVLAYYGIDASRLLGRKPKDQDSTPPDTRK